jgi:GT2 family glycosyltransferase
MSPAPDLLICIENGSVDGSTAEVKEGAPESVMFIDLVENVGFAEAVNIGVQIAIAAGAEHILLLNNDATVSPDCLRKCLGEFSGQQDVAAVGPAIAFMDAPASLWFGGGLVSDWFSFSRHRGLRKPSASPPPSSDTAFVTGCCMVISGAAWTAVGPFRGELFAYYEDVDWCQRARSAGWRCRYLGEVLCLHAVSVSSATRGSLNLSPRTAYYMARNPMRVALDTKSRTRRLTRVLGLLTVWNAVLAWRLVQTGSVAAAFGCAHGLYDAFRGRMGDQANVRL